MAIIHRTTMRPTKLELLTAWLPTRQWYQGDGATPELTKVGGFRLDDPEGEVGIEFMAATDASGDRAVTYHVPMTYRAAPLDDADDALIGTSEHGVLGRRWIYDGTRDRTMVAGLCALLIGEAEPQAQSINNTPDPTVTSYFAGGDLEAGEFLNATDTPDATYLLVKDLSVRVNRVLVPDAGVPLGYVTAGWAAPDGTKVRGHYVVVVE
jgi:hypothetical protein